MKKKNKMYITVLDFELGRVFQYKVEPEENLLSNAIRACNKLDEENGLLRGNSDGLD